jgi:hypothetical protein
MQDQLTAFWLFSSLLSSQVDVLIKWHSGTITLDGMMADVNHGFPSGLWLRQRFPDSTTALPLDHAIPLLGPASMPIHLLHQLCRGIFADMKRLPFRRAKAVSKEFAMRRQAGDSTKVHFSIMPKSVG